MEWLLIVALGAWVFGLSREQSALKRRLSALEARGIVARSEPDAAATPPQIEPPAEIDQTPEPSPWGAAEPAPAPEPSSPTKPSRPPINAAAWLSEHGLAWLGGGALALGGLFVVAYAAQRGFFTPALRIGIAVVIGLAMIAVSEWLRRQLSEQGRGPAAALLAGAGAATLYGATWASDRLYGFIGVPASAPLLGLISAGLLGLAFLHGMPLALAALFGAYLAPVVTGGPGWAAVPQTAYLLLILLTGYAVATFRGWKQVAWGASAGAAIWAIANIADGGGAHAAALLVASPLAAVLAGLWARRRTGLEDPLPHAASVALLSSALIAAALWWPPAVAVADAFRPEIAAACWIAVILLAAVAAGWRLAPGLIQPIVYGLAVAGLVGAQTTGAGATRNGVIAVLFGLIVAGLLGMVRAADNRSRLYAASAPVLAALSLIVLSLSFPASLFTLGWAAPAAAAAVVALTAAWLGRRAAQPSNDLPLALWIWSAAALAGRAIFAALALEWTAPAISLITLLGVLLHVRLGWRGFGAAAVAAAVTALLALFGLAGLALDQKVTVLVMSLAFAATAAATYGASRIVRAKDAPLADALSTGAIIMGLAGLFLLIRLRVGQPQLGLEPLLEIALQVILLLAAGLMSARGSGAAQSRIGRWRQHLFLLAGLAYGVIALLLVWNPLWNPLARPIKGPPIFDGLAAAYLAPAILLALAVQRWVAARRALASAYAAGATVFGLAWAGLELRRLFKGPGFAWGPEVIGRAESAAYVLLMALVAYALALAARRARLRPQFELVAGDLATGARAFEWAAMGLGAFVFGWLASPWWGPITRPLDDHPSALLLLALYAAGVGMWLALVRREGAQGLVARVAAALQVFLLVTLAVRYGFRGLDMASARAEAGLETWAFSAIWAAYGLAVLALGARRRDMALRWTGLGLLLFTTAKVLLFDMARLDGMIRAASFLALGALLIVAALAARRFSGANGKAAEEPRERPADPA